MTKRTENWIRITTPDGEIRIASPAFICKLLGVPKIEADVWNLRQENMRLKRRLIFLETPYRQKEVIALLSQAEKPHNFMWLKNRIDNLCFMDLEPLIEDDSLSVRTKAGHRMFYVAGVSR